jgi:hypothetical protein
MHFYKLMLIILLFSICWVSTNAQRLTAGQKLGNSFVIAYPKKGEINRLELLSSKAEMVNGKLNIVYNLADGSMVQINGIPKSWLKDTACVTDKVQMVYISGNQDTTLVSRSTLRIRIKCMQPKVGEPLLVYVLGRVSKSNRANTFETNYFGLVPVAEMMQETN